MNDLKPILQHDPSSAEARLLRTALLDGPPKDNAARLLASLGVGAAPPAATVASAGAAASGTAAESATVIAKWLCAGMLAGSLAARMATIVPAPDHASAATGAVPEVTAPGATAVEPASLASSNEDLGAAPPARVGGQTAQGPALHPQPAPPTLSPTRTRRAPSEQPQMSASAPKHATLDEEVRSLDAARMSLARGAAAEALSRLALHRSRFVPGRLAPEEILLRVETLVALGRVTEAQTLGTRFLATEQARPYAKRMRTLLEHTGREAR